ncbi:MAG TPA: aromatic-ring-hydroxylating dioxygenase subunit beta [Burkholderiales bacterium]|nr:aromatic-ring-hydroxylating dioxygenase subunit beta [Burkholderiales bacterium]
MSYVDDRFYADIVAAFTDWQRPELELTDVATRDECRRLLEREARLLDEARFEEWLALYAEQCIVWVPAAERPGDPRREVTMFFDDRQRLQDRIFRLRTGKAWSQVPPSRTVRMVSNVEVFRAGQRLMVRSNLLLTEFRAGETRTLAAWCAHRLASGKIEAKQMNLLERDQSLRNPSILL